MKKVFLLLLVVLLAVLLPASCGSPQKDLSEYTTLDIIQEEANETTSQDRQHSFFKNDILPFVYEFPTVPRMWAVVGWPVSIAKYEVSHSRLTSVFGLNSDYEYALNRFKGLMYVSGFERVIGLSATLDTNIYAADACVVFQKDNVFVSMEMRDIIGTITCESAPVYPSVYIRMAKIYNWTAVATIEIDTTDFDNELLDFLLNESRYDFFRYEGIEHLAGVSERAGGRYDDLTFSLQEIVGSPPVDIIFRVGNNRVDFLYELCLASYCEFLCALDTLMHQNGFVRVYEISETDRYFLISGNLTDVLSAQLVFSNPRNRWDIFIEEKPIVDEAVQPFIFTALYFGLNTR